MRCAVYIRVSTPEQNETNQLPALQDYAKRKGWDVVEVYAEQASAWHAGHQGELRRLLRDARRGRFSVCLVWALDRLSREGALPILSLVHRLASCGVKVISLHESWTEAPGELAEVLYALVGWVARMESERRSQRTKAGLERLRREGRKLGRPVGSKDRRKRSAPRRRRVALSDWPE